VETAVTAQVPGATVTIITTPRALDDETVLERVLHVAAVMRHPVHHITVQHIGDQLSVSLDLEVDGQMRSGGRISSPRTWSMPSSRNWAPASRWRRIWSRC
jgi:hypothetical protein